LKQDKYASVAIGPTTTLGYETILDYEPVFGARLFSPLGFSGS